MIQNDFEKNPYFASDVAETARFADPEELLIHEITNPVQKIFGRRKVRSAKCSGHYFAGAMTYCNRGGHN